MAASNSATSKESRTKARTSDRSATSPTEVDIDSEQESLTLGTWLDFHPVAERINHSAEASALLKGDYREPFVVPDYEA